MKDGHLHALPTATQLAFVIDPPMAYIWDVALRLHTVVETPEFVAGARRVLADTERAELIDYLAASPTLAS